jgi:hypothetical protein
MRFEEALQGWTAGRLTQAEAAMLLGQCERSFRRHVERYGADGLEGLLDKRLSQAPSQCGRSRSGRADLQERLCRLERGALSQQVPQRIQRHTQLQLGQDRAAGRGTGQEGQGPRQAPHQARTRTIARDDAAPGRQHAPLGTRRGLGPGGHDGRRHGRAHQHVLAATRKARRRAFMAWARPSPATGCSPACTAIEAATTS